MNPSGFSDLLNRDMNTSNLFLFNNNPSSVVYIDEDNEIQDYQLQNGQIIIGDTGKNPKVGNIAGSSNIVVANGPGSIGINTIQNIDSLASPEWATVKLNNLNATSLVGASGAKQLQSLTLASNNGVVSGVSGNTLTVSTAQDIRSSARPSWNQINVLNGNNAICNTASFTPLGSGNVALPSFQSMGYDKNVNCNNNTSAGTFCLRSITTGGSNTSYGYDSCVTLSTQSNNTAIGAAAGRNTTSSTSTFLGASADAVGAFSNVTCVGYQAAATASNTMVLGNSAVTSIISGSNGVCDLGNASRYYRNAYITDCYVNNLVASKPVRTNASKQLVSGLIDISNVNDVTGILPVANGGTNSSAALTNQKLMGSSGGAIVETTINNSNGANFSMSGTVLNAALSQNLGIGANPSFGSPYITGMAGGLLLTPPLPGGGQMYSQPAQDGKFLIGSFDSSNFYTFWQQGTITGSSNITVVKGSPHFTGIDPYFNIDTIQPIQTTSTPTFANLVLSGATPRVTYDLGDFQEYDVTGNRHTFYIGNTLRFQISNTAITSSLPFVASGGSMQLALTTITAPGFGAPRTHSIPFAANSNFILSEAGNVFGSTNTFNGTTNLNGAANLNGSVTIGAGGSGSLIVGDSNFGAGITTGDDPKIRFNSNAYLGYTRSSATYEFRTQSALQVLSFSDTSLLARVPIYTTATSNQIRVGTVATTTLNINAPSAARTHTLADPGANANFVMSEGTQTINGAKSFTKLIKRNAVYFSGASSTSLANGSFTCPIYGTTFAISDPAGMYTSANARFTAQTSGLYQVHVFCRLQDQALGVNDTIGISLYRNGSSTSSESFSAPDSGGRRCINGMWMMNLTAGDYLQVFNYQNSGTAIGADRCNFSMAMIN